MRRRKNATSEASRESGERAAKKNFKCASSMYVSVRLLVSQLFSCSKISSGKHMV
jgi:hypothetical protein